MDFLKPFDAIPEQVERSLKKALVASRTLVQALAVGRNTVSSVMKVHVNVVLLLLLLFWLL